MSGRRGGRKLGLQSDQEKKEVIEAMRIARDAALKVHLAYSASSIPYQAAVVVRDNCKHLAALISGDKYILDPPGHSTSFGVLDRD